METRQLDAAEQPCAMRLSHNPRPIRTQGHHRWPQYLQRRLWGSVRLEDLIPLCGTDHDSTHTWLSFLLGEQRKPLLDPGTLVKTEAQAIVTWFRAEQEKLAAATAFGSGAFGSGAFGDAVAGDDTAAWDGIE